MRTAPSTRFHYLEGIWWYEAVSAHVENNHALNILQEDDSLKDDVHDDCTE